MWLTFSAHAAMEFIVACGGDKFADIAAAEVIFLSNKFST